VADSNQNIYGTLDRFKDQYSKSFLLRIGSREDEEPTDFDTDIDNRLTEGLKQASDRMDGYIASVGNDTPVDPAPDYFEPDCYCIAVGILIRRKGYEPDTPDHEAVKGADKCEDKYKALAKGTWQLQPADDEGKMTPPSRLKSGSPDPVFSGTRLDGYVKGDVNG
jgi:hypothetical protein